MILDQNSPNIKQPQTSTIPNDHPIENSKEFTESVYVTSFPDRNVVNNLSNTLLNDVLDSNKTHTIDKKSHHQKASLGTYAKLSAIRENKGIAADNKSRYRLLKTSRRLIRELCQHKHKMAQCHHGFIPHANPTLQDNGTGKGYSWGNVIKCDNPYCPVCSVRVAHELRHKLAQAVSNASTQGLKVVMMTLTCQHDARHTALDNVKAMIRAWNKFRGCRKYRELFDAHGVVDYIRVTDATFNPINGNHFHFHVLLFIDQKQYDSQIWQNPPSWNFDDIDQNGHFWQIFQHWQAQLNKLDRTCLARYALDIRQTDDYVADYVAKIGHAPQGAEWDITAEASLSPLKRASDNHYTLHQLLILADKGDTWAAGMWSQYIDAMKHRSHVQWSKGLQDRLGVGETPLDDKVIDMLAQFKPTFEATRAAWRYLRADRNIRADLLVAANNGDYELVARELAKCDVIGLFLQNNGDDPPAAGWHVVSNYDLSTAKHTVLGRVYVHQGKVVDAHASVVIVPTIDKMRVNPGTHKSPTNKIMRLPTQLRLLKGVDAGDNMRN